MWKLGVSAAVAIRLIRAARPCIRPNVGFVRQVIFDRDVCVCTERSERSSKPLQIPAWQGTAEMGALLATSCRDDANQADDVFGVLRYW